MKTTISSIWKYTKLVFTKWVLYAFLVLDLVALAAQVIYTPLSIPQPVFYAILAIGVYWASYQTYHDIVIELPSLPKEPPPFEILPVSFEIRLSSDIPQVSVTLYIVNHQNRELVIESFEILDFRLSSTGNTIDSIRHPEPVRIAPKYSQLIICNCNLGDNVARIIGRTQTSDRANASFRVIIRASSWFHHFDKNINSLSANGLIWGISPQN